MVLWKLVDTAKEAVAQAKEDHKTDSPLIDPNTNDSTDNKISITVAKQFLSKTCPDFLKSKAGQDEDRLVKVGRSIADLIEISADDTIRSALETIVDQCVVLGKGNLKVPKVRFGKTEIQMPIVTLGCMRFQVSVYWIIISTIETILVLSDLCLLVLANMGTYYY